MSQQVFISHIAEDGGVVQEIASGLDRAGYTSWYYEDSAVGGMPHRDQTRSAIKQAEVFALLISSRALDNPGPYIEIEIHQAVKQGKRFLPLLLDVDYSQLENRKPGWEEAFVGAVAIRIRPNLSYALTRIITALQSLGVRPERAGEGVPAVAKSGGIAVTSGEVASTLQGLGARLAPGEPAMSFDPGTATMVMQFPGADPGAGRLRVDLVGRWNFGEAEGEGVLELRPDGSLAGTQWLFGALPPLPISGRWWVQGEATLILDYTAAVDPTGVLNVGIRFMQLTYPIELARVEQNAIVGVTEGEQMVMRRMV